MIIYNKERVEKMKGRVKWWCQERGYGFIEYNESENIFAHLSKEDIDKENIKENQEIEFYIEEVNNCSYIHILKLLEN